jgi:prepilin-type N-terminal cleavage/methylation domain-containing protein
MERDSMAMKMKTGAMRSGQQRGMSLIELMVALTVLMIGVTGCVVVIPFATQNDFRSKQQSNSTVISQMVMEKIMSVPAGTSPTLQLADCVGNNPNINTTGSVGGTGAALASSGDVDFTQTQASAGAGYYMSWTTCGSAGQTSTYDVRWNIKSPDSQVKIITVSARLQRTGVGITFAPPSTIRSVLGPWS